MNTHDDEKRLRWKCRRGMLELDLWFTAYLDHCYPTANDEERVQFNALIEITDPELFSWLVGQTPAPVGFQPLITRIQHAATLST